MTKNRTRILLITVLCALSVILLFEKFVPRISSRHNPYKSFELLDRVVYLLRRDYIEEPEPGQAMKGALKGVVDSLDVLSCYLDRESVLDYIRSKDSALFDIGAVLYKRYGAFPQVIGIIANSPAQKSGLEPGDIISELDGQPTRMMSLVEIQIALKDKIQKPVKLRVLRGTGTLEVTVEREALFNAPFSFGSAEGTCGILTIHHLYPPLVKMVKEKIVPRIIAAGSPLVLDLRNCHEGDVAEACRLLNLFLRAQKIGYFEKKGGQREYLSCPDRPELEKLPVVVWTNQATLGPAEIVAGVMREFKRAKIIGLRTPGLAARQSFFPLEDGSGLLLTSAIFYLNSGGKIWENGVKPDVSIDVEDQSLSAYLTKSFTLLP